MPSSRASDSAYAERCARLQITFTYLLTSHAVYRAESYVDAAVRGAESAVSSVPEVQRPKRLSLNGTADSGADARPTSWNSGRRFSEDVLAARADDARRPTAVGRLQPRQVRARRAARLPPPVTQRRTSQPSPAADVTRRRFKILSRVLQLKKLI